MIHLPGLRSDPFGARPAVWDGLRIVLMADAPTVGGYRIAGGVISADLSALAQCLPGERVEFKPVRPETAQRAIEREAERLERAREWSLA